MSVFHQSELTQYSRCPKAGDYERRSAQRKQLSATAYGSVIHYALLEVFERQRHTDGITLEQATGAALDTFRHYWHPMNIQAICEPVDTWLPKQSFNSLLKRGEDQIAAYAAYVATRDETVLATEIGFQVPIDGTEDPDTGEPHILAGTIDRLALIKHKGTWAIEVGDIKTGKDYPYLRQNMQFSAYTYATTKPEFWLGWNGEDGFGAEYGQELYDKFATAPRRATWINMTKMAFQDAGWRGPIDYHRFALAISELAKAYRYDVFPLNISGQTCTFCEFKDICAGTGVAPDDHGAPEPFYPPQGTRKRKTA
jgi:hypothetical protein